MLTQREHISTIQSKDQAHRTWPIVLSRVSRYILATLSVVVLIHLVLGIIELSAARLIGKEQLTPERIWQVIGRTRPDEVFFALLVGTAGLIAGPLSRLAVFRRLGWKLTLRYTLVTIVAFQILLMALLAFIAGAAAIDISHWSFLFVYGLAIMALLAGLVGTVSGFVTARGLVQRLEQLAQTAAKWSQGDLSALVEDPSPDEIGHLARDLNRMAGQLERVLEERRLTTATQERERLARDLHDSIKQQTFAVSAQLGTARALIRRDAEAAEAHLLEAERLADQVRKELNTLIYELHPAELVDRDLADALSEYAGDWSQQHGIRARVEMEGRRPVPTDVEEALFRVSQEALSNVARHSKAGGVLISLNYSSHELLLTISDDGQGYHVEQEQRGIGLYSMHARVASLGGTLSIESAPGKGTRITARVPLDETPEKGP